jgi:Arc/MetJ-type ribon-helix-helix transcriptional regulator
MVTFRSDDALDDVLTRLARPGESRSDTIRRAIRDADTLARRDRMRREAEDVVEDDADVAEARAVQADLEALRAW